MSVRVAPEDARRGGLVILGGDADTARLYADGGYESVVAEPDDDLDELIAGLRPPVFLLALPDDAATAWSVGKVAATSIVADSRIGSHVGRAPAVPTILHLERAAHDEYAGAFATSQPELPVHLHQATADGERLFQLRTLRLFSSAGGRGEI